MIAVDESLHPIAVKPLALHNDLQKRRFEEAKLRKEIRLKFAAEHQQRKTF